MSNSLDPYQAQQHIWPDLDPNCLKRLSADGTRRQGYEIKEDFLRQLYNLNNFVKIQVSKGSKIRNRYNQVPHLTQDTKGKVKS